jgi:ABC-type glutathione transport system ATPase component
VVGDNGGNYSKKSTNLCVVGVNGGNYSKKSTSLCVVGVTDNCKLRFTGGLELKIRITIPPDAACGDLSGGQRQQQLAFVRALISDPELMVLDEPTEGIQPSIVNDIQDVTRSIRKEGKTAILLVEQSLDFVRSIGDRFYIMEKGSIVWQGGREELDDPAVIKHLTI